ncbi:hypothetical protein NFI96_007865 [Prochilodus magdalenae]|nr:hypothetical protein NFI96_007865 [Prochilodus magdalenae]
MYGDSPLDREWRRASHNADTAPHGTASETAHRRCRAAVLRSAGPQTETPAASPTSPVSITSGVAVPPILMVPPSSSMMAPTAFRKSRPRMRASRMGASQNSWWNSCFAALTVTCRLPSMETTSPVVDLSLAPAADLHLATCHPSTRAPGHSSDTIEPVSTNASITRPSTSHGSHTLFSLPKHSARQHTAFIRWGCSPSTMTLAMFSSATTHRATCLCANGRCTRVISTRSASFSASSSDIGAAIKSQLLLDFTWEQGISLLDQREQIRCQHTQPLPSFCTVTHSLRYIYTAVTPGIDSPEYTALGLVDGEQFVYYDSNIRKMIPKTEWIKENEGEEYWNRETENQLGTQEVYKTNVATGMQRFNQTTGECKHTESVKH